MAADGDLWLTTFDEDGPLPQDGYLTTREFYDLLFRPLWESVVEILNSLGIVASFN